MKSGQQNKVILVMGSSPQTLPSQPVMSIEQTDFNGELISLSGRPDALVLLPACANFYATQSADPHRSRNAEYDNLST
jgi:hypothetical protein